MPKLNVLSGDGAVNILRQLCMGEARFGELNRVVTNTRTLSRRLGELRAEGLIRKVGARYGVTDKGFNTTLKIAELEEGAEHKWINHLELAKIRHGWMRISLKRLTELLLKEFGDELISIVLYGSAVKGSFQLGRSDIDLLYILEDCARNVWKREEGVFKGFQSTWEYRACDYWLRMQFFYGYPEVTVTPLQRSYAKVFQPTYLDMVSHSAVLYDKEGVFQGLMERLREALKALGAVRVEHADGTYCWLLKPDITPGELIEINLG